MRAHAVFTLLVWLLSITALADSSCSQVDQVKVTFYGYPDNTPPGAGIDCTIDSLGNCTSYTSGCTNTNTYSGRSIFERDSTDGTGCGPRGETAGGSGTYNDPLTMASSGKWFCHLEVVYLPYLQKYLRYEDYCKQCIQDANANQDIHIDIWTGSNKTNGGNVQIQCENNLTPSGLQAMIRNPSPDLPVDSKPCS